ncbi:MAG: hypothetical protein HOI80_03060 [Alphaproteobacteria bacterium]|jgi:hypothetical protein|nr:hypothetical protein [Alphaproteobacteria bacterium]MBT5389137.1 hypothetical protein [Alphaproteobacteria bacterium]MBT5654463.1 hypothetical protein [Alphaproteobacteria bacterium]
MKYFISVVSVAFLCSIGASESYARNDRVSFDAEEGTSVIYAARTSQHHAGLRTGALYVGHAAVGSHREVGFYKWVSPHFHVGKLAGEVLAARSVD